MNYRHAFHAGNFADVFKHAVVTRVLVHLKEKASAFRVIDTHAGAGLYDLAGPEAMRTLEWKAGIGRLRAATLDAPIRSLLSPYMDIIAALNAGGDLRRYPGSPVLALRLLRPQDRLLASELEPNTAAILRRSIGADKRVRVVEIDGWTAFKAYIPPTERRGLVMVDPAYEDRDEFTRLAESFQGAYRKWSSGIYVLWYPVKTRAEPQALARHLRKIGIAKILRAELLVEATNDAGRLIGAGLIVVNPPWKLHGELEMLLPALASVLGQGAGAGFTLDWILAPPI
jgi:23S rRNA (adenine2030-N6)-methyltransferase